ncbi:hypothetical protein G7K71_17680 [Desulfofundulus sp. TPOSR]|uniref:acetyl-CoA carboxylase biotin carboxyl carrier protein n=1 Tax=Desulfofundulus sp. TPOSR TaxID=2714340 RepID=UPI0014092688|nr:biotin/lipoyl-containing protein [Desulfofundulus sp. TPOSR]NHM28760.1 hypothetical protein [Desulfofundulus sp. TPOSR]
MQLSYEDVMEILRVIDSCECQELNIAWGDFKLVLKKYNRSGNGEALSGAVMSADEPVGEAIGLPLDSRGSGETKEDSTPIQDAVLEQKAITVAPGREETMVMVKAPMVGTFYRSPAPGAPPFVEVGSIVTEGDTLCIIEVMKVMNTIKAPCKGRVVEICVENEEMVGYGQTLMVIEPLSE